MGRDVGADGFMGLAFETTIGTPVVPTKFFPIRNESLAYKQDMFYRRSIRGLADVHGSVLGRSWVEGDIEMECLESVLPYFLYCSRNTVAKTGLGPYVYTTTPGHAAVGPLNGATHAALTLTVVRNGIPFVYTGCVVGSMEFTHDAGVLIVKFHIVGYDEATGAVPVYVNPTDVPFGHGQYTITVSAASVTDMDTFTWSIDDALEPVHRLKGTDRKPVDLIWKERSVEIKTERDFLNRTEYDAAKAGTATDVTILAQHDATHNVQIKCAATVKDAYELGLTGQGDMIRGNITYKGIYDSGTSKSYEIIVKTAESIT